MILVFVTFENKKDAEKVIEYLVDNHIVACAQYFTVKSSYFWKGERVQCTEFESILKTKEEKFTDIENAIKKLLPYEIPQIISIKAEKANKKYLDWVDKEVR